jgi:hypothetical protein
MVKRLGLAQSQVLRKEPELFVPGAQNNVSYRDKRGILYQSTKATTGICIT